MLLVCFFVTIGLNARFADLKKGGRPLLILLAATLFFAVLVVFPLLRRNHDAAVISSGFVGLALGATPTAMASMTAVTQRHGASHVAFIVVPLFGAFLIDLISAVCVRLFLAFF